MHHVISQHVVFFLTFLVAYIIPDMPSSVQKNVLRERHLMRKSLYQFEKKHKEDWQAKPMVLVLYINRWYLYLMCAEIEIYIVYICLFVVCRVFAIRFSCLSSFLSLRAIDHYLSVSMYVCCSVLFSIIVCAFIYTETLRCLCPSRKIFITTTYYIFHSFFIFHILVLANK